MRFERLFDDGIKEKIESQHKKADKKPRLRMEIIGLEAIHGFARSGVNQEAGLLEFLSRHHDLANIRVEKLRGKNRILYIEYHVLEAAEGLAQLPGLQGFVDAKASYYLAVKKGDEQRKIIFSERDKTGVLLQPDDFVEVIGKVAAKLLTEFKFEYPLRDLCAVRDFKKIPESMTTNAIVTALTGVGWQIVDAMKYHESFTFKAEYTRRKNSSIEFGYYQDGDHASLPRVIRLDFLTKLDVVKLSSIKVEKKGREGHNANYVIRAEQAPLVKKFASSFKRKMELSDT